MHKAIQRAIEGGYQSERFAPYGKRKFIIRFERHSDFIPDITASIGVRSHWIWNISCSMIREDPEFWKALGRVEGWKYRCDGCSSEMHLDQFICEVCEQKTAYKAGWFYNWYHFITYIANGNDIDTFFNKILK